MSGSQVGNQGAFAGPVAKGAAVSVSVAGRLFVWVFGDGKLLMADECVKALSKNTL